MKRMFIILLCLVAVLVAACSGQSTNTTSNSSNSATPTAESASASTSSSPAEAAKKYMDTAMTTSDDISPLICSTVTDDLKEQMKAGLAASKAAYASSGATLDLSGLTYTAQNVTDDTADVEVTGKMKITVNGATTEIDFPVNTLKMKNENGWKICG